MIYVFHDVVLFVNDLDLRATIYDIMVYIHIWIKLKKRGSLIPRKWLSTMFLIILKGCTGGLIHVAGIVDSL